MVDDPSSGPPRPLTLLLLILCVTAALPTGVYALSVVSGHFKPSVASGYSYRWYYVEWLDYCPACGHHDCLEVNPKGVPESELTCMVCGADYCGVTGLDKGGCRWRLRKPGRMRVDMDMLILPVDWSLSGGTMTADCETIRFYVQR